ncbi:MAG: hypothetical protein QM664_13075, partial [Flavihumibacter sp.]
CLPVLAALIFFVGMTACGKSKYNTKPQLELVSQPGVVPYVPEGVFGFTLRYTDKEGDLSGIRDSSVCYVPVLLNTREPVIPYLPIYASLPEFPDNSKGEIELNFTHTALYRQLLQSEPDQNDTLELKIVVKDKAGNESDTLTTRPFVLLGQ